MRSAPLFSTLATSLFLISSVNAHGFVEHLSIGGKVSSWFLPYASQLVSEPINLPWQKYLGFIPDPNSAVTGEVPGIGKITDLGTPQRPTDNDQQGEDTSCVKSSSERILLMRRFPRSCQLAA